MAPMASPAIYHETLRDDRLRLLQLDLSAADAPGAETEPLSLRLTTHSLADRPDYICASYAWREPLALRGRCDEAIFVNGMPFPVQANLAHGLRVHQAQLRQHGVAAGSEPLLWIDAVCINQNDIPERDAQVAIMHQIYREAKEVLVWLGPDPDGEACRVREFFRAVLKQYWIDNGQPNYKDNLLQRRSDTCLPEVGLPALQEDIWKATVRFWDRAWFSRTWVQQEVAMARKAQFWCGDVEFTQLELEHFSRFLTNSGMGGFLLQVRRGYAGDGEFSGAPVGVGAARFSAMQKLLRGELKSESDYDQRMCDLWTGPSDHIRDASDERDKIFALLVLMNQISISYGLERMPLVADYTRDAAGLCKDVTAWLITATGWLGALNWVSPKRSISSQHRRGMPSWVVNFNGISATTGIAILQDQPQVPLSRAKRFLVPETRPVVTNMVLSVSVQRIGTIVEYGEHWDDMISGGRLEQTAALLLNCPRTFSGAGMTRLDTWVSAWMGSRTTSPHATSIRERFGRWARSRLRVRLRQAKGAGTMSEAFEALRSELRPVFQLGEEDESGILPTEHEIEERLAGRLLPDSEGEHQRDPFDDGVHRLEHWGRRLLRLGSLGSPYCPSAVLLGIGPQTCAVGDEVCFVAGSMMPLVLRTVKVDIANGEPFTPRQAYFVGLASVANAIDPSPGQWSRWDIV